MSAITEAQKLAIAHYLVMFEASERMEKDLAKAKNKDGIVKKYMHTIPPRSKPDWQGDPFDFGEDRDAVDTLYASAAIGIGMSMHERLNCLTG